MPYNNFAYFLGYDKKGEPRYTLPDGVKKSLEKEYHPFRNFFINIIKDRVEKLITNKLNN